MIKINTVPNTDGLRMDYILKLYDNRIIVLAVQFYKGGQLGYIVRNNDLVEMYHPKGKNSFLAEDGKLLPFIRENLIDTPKQGYVVLQRLIMGSQHQYMIIDLENARNKMYTEEQLKDFIITGTTQHKRALNAIIDGEGNLKIIGRIVETILG